MRRDSSVGTATRYGLNSPGIESLWGGEIFRSRSESLWGPTTLLNNGPGLFPGVKRPVCGVDHPAASRVEVKDRVELYLSSPSAPSWHVAG